MSALVLLEKSESLIMAQAKKFVELAKSHKAVSFDQEASFALQLLKANPFLAKTAAENPDSLINAVHNIASVGLSLNPALNHAYLVPRDGKVCLDFGYRGLVHLPVEAGALLFAQAEIVYEKDKFMLRERGLEPIHERDPFSSDRGAVRGAYCVAKTSSGEFLVETMSVVEMLSIRDRTQAYKAFKAGKIRSTPWDSDESEMMKKTVIRRASKSWPMSNAGRFEKAMQLQDDAEPIDVTPNLIESKTVTPLDDKFKEIRKILTTLEKDEAKFISYLATVNKRKIEKIEELSAKEVEAALVQLNSWLKADQKKKEVKSEAVDENPA